MSGCLRVDILDHDRMLVLEQYFGRNNTLNNFFKNRFIAHYYIFTSLFKYFMLYKIYVINAEIIIVGT